MDLASLSRGVHFSPLWERLGLQIDWCDMCCFLVPTTVCEKKGSRIG